MLVLNDVLTFDFVISSVTTVPLTAVPLVCDFPLPIACSSVGVIGLPPNLKIITFN